MESICSQWLRLSNSKHTIWKEDTRLVGLTHLTRYRTYSPTDLSTTRVLTHLPTSYYIGSSHNVGRQNSFSIDPFHERLAKA